jgi:hypothetical protein
LSAKNASSSVSASCAASRSGAAAAAGGGRLPVTSSSLADMPLGKLPKASIGVATPSSSRSALFGSGPEPGDKTGAGDGAGCVAGGALIGCKGGTVSAPLEVDAGSGNGMRLPLRRRLTLGYATCNAGRTSGEPLLPNHTFTSSERGSRLTLCAPVDSASVVPIGRENVKVAA